MGTKIILHIISFNFFWIMSMFHPTFAQNVQPQTKNGLYFFQFANIYFEVDPNFAGRISSFKLNNNEVLFVDRSDKKDILGSTLWPSPQSFWKWPPLATLCDDKYSGGIDGNKIILTSKKDSLTGLIFKKTFIANDIDTSITILYEMTNSSEKPVSFALWELSRVPAEGLIFFPFGDSAITGPLGQYFSKQYGIAWYKHSNRQKGYKKMFSDGKEGWSAFLNDKNILFVKSFNDLPISQQAPGEKEIEYWLTKEHSFIELENQVPYTELKPNETSIWKIKWYLRELPTNIKPEVGNSELVSYTRNLIKK